MNENGWLCFDVRGILALLLPLLVFALTLTYRAYRAIRTTGPEQRRRIWVSGLLLFISYVVALGAVAALIMPSLFPPMPIWSKVVVACVGFLGMSVSGIFFSSYTGWAKRRVGFDFRAPTRKAIIFGVAYSLCIVLCLVSVGWGIVTGLARLDEASESVRVLIEQFADEMAEEDVVGAYELFSARAQRQVAISDLEEMIESGLFEEYNSIWIPHTSFGATDDRAPDVARDRVATARVVVTYDNGTTREFAVVLEREGEEWRLYEFEMVVPPEDIDSL